MTEATINLAAALNKDNQSSEARKVLINRLSIIEEDWQRAIIFDALSEIENSLGNKTISIYCKDKSLEYNPNNLEELFSSAFEASGEEVNEIAISNYLKLTKFDSDHSIALNNLGVQAQEAELSIIAMENYKKASDLNNTLAMANMGYLLLEAGFTEHAEEIAKRALKQDDPHQNVHSLMTAISEKKEAQRDEWAKLSQKSLSRQREFRSYIEQYYLGNSDDLKGKWLARESYQTTIQIENNELEAILIEPGGLVLRGTYTARLTGDVSGSTFSGSYTRKFDGDGRNTILETAGNLNKSCIGYLSEDKQKFKLISPKHKDDFSLILSRLKS